MKWPDDNLIPDIDNNNQLVFLSKPSHIEQDECMVDYMKNIVGQKAQVLSVSVKANGIPSDVSYGGRYHRVSAKDPVPNSINKDTRQSNLHLTLKEWDEFQDAPFHYVSILQDEYFQFILLIAQQQVCQMCVTPGPKKRGYDFKQLLPFFLFGLRHYAVSGLLFQGEYQDYRICDGVTHVTRDNRKIPVYSSASGVIILNLTADVLILYYLVEELISKYYVVYVESENSPHHLAAKAMKDLIKTYKRHDNLTFTWTALRESVSKAINGGFRHYEKYQEMHGHKIDARKIKRELQSRGKTGILAGKYLCFKLRKSAHAKHNDAVETIGHGISEGGLFFAPFDDERENMWNSHSQECEGKEEESEDDCSSFDGSPDSSFVVSLSDAS